MNRARHKKYLDGLSLCGTEQHDLDAIEVTSLASAVTTVLFLTQNFIALDPNVVAGRNGKRVDNVRGGEVELLEDVAQGTDQEKQEVLDAVKSAKKAAERKHVWDKAVRLEVAASGLEITTKETSGAESSSEDLSVSHLDLRILVVKSQKRVCTKAVGCDKMIDQGHLLEKQRTGMLLGKEPFFVLFVKRVGSNLG